jgi:hypothetical protein
VGGRKKGLLELQDHGQIILLSTRTPIFFCRMHDQDHRISVWFNDSILTEDLSTNNRDIPMGYIDG